MVVCNFEMGDWYMAHGVQNVFPRQSRRHLQQRLDERQMDGGAS